ncbi:MAG: DUF4253 domain-containing protein [Phycisphaerales bacterium]|nr:DUF4253 domain-containing protein [Phycisphaerales bacterium]
MESFEALRGTVRITRTSGEAAADEWRALRDKVAQTGLYPVICRDESCIENITQILEDLRAEGATPDSILAGATPEAVAKWRAASELDPDDIPRAEFESEEEDEEITFDTANPVSVVDFDEEFLDEVLILHVPASNGWEAIANLAWGNFNECPRPEIIAAHARDWHARYGAELCVVCDDTLEFLVRTRPQSQDEAIDLALEMYTFCQDIVDQGVESVEQLAAVLLVSAGWFFWWD